MGQSQAGDLAELNASLCSSRRKARNMKELIAIAALFLVVPAWASAGNADKPVEGQVYLFVGPIATTYVGPAPNWGQHINTGLGGEVLFYKGLGVAAEAGYARSGSTYQSVGIGSIDLSYHFINKKHHNQIEPFAIGGTSVYFGNGGYATGFNLGGGVNVWAARHLAVRFEIRDHAHIDPSEFPGRSGFVAFRFGVTVR